MYLLVFLVPGAYVGSRLHGLTGLYIGMTAGTAAAGLVAILWGTWRVRTLIARKDALTRQTSSPD